MRPGSGLSRRDAPTHVQAFPNLLDDLGHERFEIGRRAARDDALIGHNRFIAPIAARIDDIGLDRLVITTRGKADSFRGFQSGASQIPWWRTGGSPCGQGLRFARIMTQPSFGAWRKRPGTRVKVGGCWRWPRSMMAALGPKPRRSAASGCRPSGTGWCGSTPAGLKA